MPYYGAGDYYQAGGYYRGDYYQAGGIGSFLKKVGGKLLRAVPGVGAIATGIDLVKSIVPGPAAGGMRRIVAPPGDPFESAVDTFGGEVETVPTFAGKCHRRVKLCPKRLGKGPNAHIIMAPCPKRMNVTNVRALRRAGRRVRGFLKVARRLGALPVSHGGGKKLFKARKRR